MKFCYWGLATFFSCILLLSPDASWSLDRFSCKKCSYDLCKRCLNLALAKENKEREIARLEGLIKQNQEVMQRNRSASALIKINSNILLGSLNKEALKTELEGILNQFRSCQQCQ